MAGIGIEVRLHDVAVRAALAKLARRAGAIDLLGEDLGLALTQIRQKRFDRQRGPHGRRWEPLSPATLKRRKSLSRGGIHPILIQRGHLKGSITYQVAGRTLTVGSNMVYARIHQLGGQAGRGHSVTIPARPYLDWDHEDELNARKIVLRHLDLAGIAAMGRGR